VGLVQHDFEWCSVDGAVAPTTGERFCLEWPSLHAETCQFFVEAFAQAFPHSWNSLLRENRGAHTAQRMRGPAHVRSGWLPPYGPELHPIERVWRDLQDDLAWQQFPRVDTQQDHVSQLLQAYDAPTRQSLTGDASLVEAMNALGS